MIFYESIVILLQVLPFYFKNGHFSQVISVVYMKNVEKRNFLLTNLPENYMISMI